MSAFVAEAYSMVCVYLPTLLICAHTYADQYKQDLREGMCSLGALQSLALHCDMSAGILADAC